MVEDTVDEESEAVETLEKKPVEPVDELEKLQAAEKILFAIDRQIITEGIRLVMILPAVVILFLFSSWAYVGPSPSWWLGNIEPLAPICKRCTKQSAGALTKSKHWDWSKPTEP